MAGLGDLFGRNSVGEQLFVWGVLSTLVSAAIGPGVTELEHLVNDAAPVAVLSPGELAALVARGHLSVGAGAADARKAGLDESKFTELVQLARTFLPLGELIALYHRGAIPWDSGEAHTPSVAWALREAGVPQEWIGALADNVTELPSWSDALDALLQGQLDEQTARAWYKRAGGDDAAFQWLFDSRGTAPTPDMLATMANRRIIGWDGSGPSSTSYHQGFLEGPWRNKWEAPMRKLAQYLPPPRTVTALLRAGSITQDHALALFQAEGLSPEDAAAYVKDATAHHATTAKELTQAQIEQLYGEHLLTADQAHQMLHALGYDATTAALLTSHIDLRRVAANTSAAVTRVRSLFYAGKISAADATDTLGKLGVARTEAVDLVSEWGLVKVASVKQLTEGQITAAYEYAVLTEAQARTELEHLGYTPFDAWVLLSVKNKAPLPNKPVQ